MDLTVPLAAVSDYNLSQAIVANVVRDGHWYVNPLLGAPGEQELYHFPVTLLDPSVCMCRRTRSFTRNTGLAINLLFYP